MYKRKIDLKFEAVPVLYKNIEDSEFAILSISSSSKKLNNLLKSKLLNRKFLVSKFQKNISRIFKNNYDEKETSFLVVNAFGDSDFKKKLIDLADQFAGTSLVVKSKNDKYYLDVEYRHSNLKAAKKRNLYRELLKWNNGNFEFEDEIFLYAN